MVNKVVVLHCRHCHIHSFIALFPESHFRFNPGSAKNTMASFNARAHRNAFHSATGRRLGRATLEDWGKIPHLDNDSEAAFDRRWQNFLRSGSASHLYEI